MLYFWIFILMVLCLYRHIVYKDVFKCPLTIFLLFYTGCLFFASLHMNNKNELTWENIAVNILSMTIVAISFCFFSKIKIKMQNKECVNMYKQRTISINMLYLLAVILLIFSFKQFMSGTVLLYLQGYNMGDIRGIYLTTDSIISSPISAFIDTVFGGLRIVLLIITAHLFFSGEKRIKWLLLLVTIDVLIRSLTGGDRLFIFDYCIVFATTYFVSKKEEISKRVLQKIRRIVILEMCIRDSRYNLGAGSKGDSHILTKNRQTECFLNADGTYNFNNDKNAQQCLSLIHI